MKQGWGERPNGLNQHNQGRQSDSAKNSQIWVVVYGSHTDPNNEHQDRILCFLSGVERILLT